MRGFEHAVSLFFNDVSEIPVLNQMITDHKAIYNLFGSGIYHKPHYIFKSKSYEFHNRNIGLFNFNDTRVAGCFIVRHRDMRMRKSLLDTVSSAGFNTMSLNSKLSKVVSYIQDNKSWDRIYVTLKLISPCIWALRMAYSKKSGMEKVYHYYQMKNTSINKSSSNIENEESLPVSGSFSKHVRSSSHSDDEE